MAGRGGGDYFFAGGYRVGLSGDRQRAADHDRGDRAQVVARHVFQEPPTWTEEAARYAIVWTGMLGPTIAFKARFDPVLVTFARHLSGPAGLVMALLRGAAILLFMVPMLYFRLFSITGDPLRGFLGRAADRSMESLGLPMLVVAIAVPIAALVILVHLAAAGLSRRGGDGQP